MAKKRITLETLADNLEKMDARNDGRFAKLATRLEKGFASIETRMENNFAAVAEDISKLATKDDVAAVHTQVNAIERQLRDMKHAKLEDRVTAIEEKVFGESRA